MGAAGPEDRLFDARDRSEWYLIVWHDKQSVYSDCSTPTLPLQGMLMFQGSTPYRAAEPFLLQARP